MHEVSRGILARDLDSLLGVGRNDMDMLVVTPRQTSNGLIVMVRDGNLQLVYPQAGWFDLRRVARFWWFAWRKRLSPRFQRWGKELIHRVSLGSDATIALRLIDDFFAAVHHTTGPFALDFHRSGLGPPSSRGAA